MTPIEPLKKLLELILILKDSESGFVVFGEKIELKQFKKIWHLIQFKQKMSELILKFEYVIDSRYDQEIVLFLAIVNDFQTIEIQNVTFQMINLEEMLYCKI